MDALHQRMTDAVLAIVAIDPHTHVNPLRPTAKSLDDLLSYHYWTELSHSAGMPASAIGRDIAPADRIRAIARHLPRLSNTVQHQWLLDIARDLLGADVHHVDENNVAELAKLAEGKMAAPGWQQAVLDKSHIDIAFLTNDFDDPLTGFDTRRFVPCLRCDELVFKLGSVTNSVKVLDRLAKCTGIHVKDAATLEQAIGAVFSHFVGHGVRACAIGLPPEFAPEPVARPAVELPLARLLSGQPTTDADNIRISNYVFWAITQQCADHRLPFDLMIGAIRGVYPAGVTGGQDLFDRRVSLAQYLTVFNAFPRVKFPVSIIDSGGNPELVTFGWIMPNVYPAGHWWYSNIPALIECDLRARLQAVPRTKLIGYYSDMYMLELGYPKFNMYRRCLARVLADEFVIARGWSEDKAMELAGDLLRRNVQRVFYGQEQIQ